VSQPFRVGVTRDFLKPDGSLAFDDIGLRLLDQAPDVSWEFLAEAAPELRADQVRGYDALIVLAPQVSAATLAGADRLLHVARFGVGYDSVDVDACTRAGVLLTITPDGVRRPVATSVLGFLLALSLRMFQKDRLTREGRWAEKLDYNGVGLTGRTLGIVGLGNIGREILALVRPLGMRHLVFDPFLTPDQASEAGAELVDLETLLGASDFVSANCPLTPDTHHLLNAERLALMRPTSYLINTARGPIVDQQALTDALASGRLAGAALDVFEEEPVATTDPILALDNVIVAPHGICWTDECFRGIGRSACGAVLEVAAGRVPRFVVNREVLESERLRHRLVARAAESNSVRA
jgi:phosphoglycerate dehydrogenase-like enzyme